MYKNSNLTNENRQIHSGSVTSDAIKFPFAVNRSGRNKDWNFDRLASDYVDTDGTIFDVQNEIKQGYAICAGLLNGQRRKKSNVVGSHWILIDIDNSDVLRDENGKTGVDENGKGIKIYSHQMTLDEAIVDPFIAQHCALIYTTASHRSDWHKFRLVFLLPERIDNIDLYESMVRLMMDQLPHDPACKDASRVFYGSTEAEFPLVQPNAVLPSDWVNQARILASTKKAETASRKVKSQESQQNFERQIAASGSDIDAEIVKALNLIPPRMPGSGNYEECFKVLVALTSYYGIGAISVAERWSPSITGNTWNIESKVKSILNGVQSIHINSLFFIAKQYGYRAPRVFTPATGFKPVAELSERDRSIDNRMTRFLTYWEDLKKDFQILPDTKFGNVIEYEGFAPTLELKTRTTYLQGWLGAGKTETMLRSLKRQCPDKVIIWVAPRNGLLSQTEKRSWELRFSAEHYQELPFVFREHIEHGTSGIYTMAPDSFKQYATGNFNWENIILVVDEFSGVRKELLGKTKEIEQFLNAIARCERLIVADAFLSTIDYRVVKLFRKGSSELLRQKFEKSPVKIKWIETRNKQGEISFSHDGAYFGLLKSWIDKGFSRIAIATDSLLTAKQIERFFSDRKINDRGIKTWLVSSETIEENKKFMDAPDLTIEKEGIQIVIYTPTAQSGLDIQSEFDQGLLVCNGVLPPTQMLQMLGRCRKCPEWFVSAPRRSTNPNVLSPSLESAKVREWSEKLKLDFDELGFSAIDKTQGWSIWENLVSQVEKGFNSEYVYQLLQHFFKSVEMVELESSETKQWRDSIQEIKKQDAERTLKADLQNGLNLVRTETQPNSNAEVWDIKLAHFHSKFPEVAETAIAKIGTEQKDDAISMTRIMISSRIERLKNWVTAIDCIEQDTADLLEYLRSNPTHAQSQNFKRLQNITLFRVLRLDQLAKLTDDKTSSVLEVGDKVFEWNCDVIKEQWAKFHASDRLKKLFPMVESQKSFWNAIKDCMSALGYQSVGKTIRVPTKELHPNGKDSKGNQRFTRSQSRYFVGWLRMEFSGNAFFRENFTVIVSAIRDRNSREREDRAKRREKESPPPKYGAVAA